MRFVFTALFFAAMFLDAARADVVVTLTEAERRAAVALINVAVKAQGLDVAEGALIIVRKLLTAPPAPAANDETQTKKQ